MIEFAGIDRGSLRLGSEGSQKRTSSSSNCLESYGFESGTSQRLVKGPGGAYYATSWARLSRNRSQAVAHMLHRGLSRVIRPESRCLKD